MECTKSTKCSCRSSLLCCYSPAKPLVLGCAWGAHRRARILWGEEEGEEPCAKTWMKPNFWGFFSAGFLSAWIWTWSWRKWSRSKQVFEASLLSLLENVAEKEMRFKFFTLCLERLITTKSLIQWEQSETQANCHGHNNHHRRKELCQPLGSCPHGGTGAAALCRCWICPKDRPKRQQANCSTSCYCHFSRR